jgi:hypothetical protein
VLQQDGVRRVLGLPTMEEMRRKAAEAALNSQAMQASTASSGSSTASSSGGGGGGGAAATLAAYDPERAAAEIMKRVQRDAQGQPLVFTSNPAAAPGSSGSGGKVQGSSHAQRKGGSGRMR